MSVQMRLHRAWYSLARAHAKLKENGNLRSSDDYQFLETAAAACILFETNITYRIEKVGTTAITKWTYACFSRLASSFNQTTHMIEWSVKGGNKWNRSTLKKQCNAGHWSQFRGFARSQSSYQTGLTLFATHWQRVKILSKTFGVSSTCCNLSRFVFAYLVTRYCNSS